MERGAIRGRDSAKACAVGTARDHETISGSRKIGRVFISLGDTGSESPHRGHLRLLPPLMLGFPYLCHSGAARDPLPAGLMESLSPPAGADLPGVGKCSREDPQGQDSRSWAQS